MTLDVYVNKDGRITDAATRRKVNAVAINQPYLGIINTQDRIIDSGRSISRTGNTFQTLLKVMGHSAPVNATGFTYSYICLRQNLATNPRYTLNFAIQYYQRLK